MRLIFAGTPEFAQRILAALQAAGHEIELVLTQPDRPVGRGLREAASPVKMFAQAERLQLFQPQTLRSPQALQRIAELNPQVMVVAAYGLMVPPEILRVAPLGAVNVHASLLPRWRGAAPIQRALLAGDRETGISIMQMDVGLDTGPVLQSEALQIRADDDAGTLHDRLAQLGERLIVDSLRELAAGRLSPRPQRAEEATYAPKIRKEETLLDWSRPAPELERAVRAFRPAPCASTRYAGEALKIWRAQALDDDGLPGQVLRADEGGIVVACGVGALQITELQRAGGRRMAAAEFLRGRPIGDGAHLG